MGKGSNYLEGKVLGIPQSPQVWAPTVSHAIYVRVTIRKEDHFVVYLFNLHAF